MSPDKKKILTIVGARPQFIKAAVVSRRLKQADWVQEIIVHTGQHYDPEMSDIFFSEMDIPTPGYNLEIGSGSHGTQTGKMMQAIEEVFLKEKPDCVLVYGDTNSTLAGALVAAKLHITLAHVESGLRSGNKKMPEEINRICTDHVSDLLFVPTDTARQNLLHEGCAKSSIAMSGDVMYDAALFYATKSNDDILSELGLKPQCFLLATIHRAENTDSPQRLDAIFAALAELAHEIDVVLPLHPRTKRLLAERNFQNPNPERLRIIGPVSYLQMIALEKNCALIATDSGGVQKEAYFFGRPCITLRDETEWVELVNAGYNRLAEANKDKILAAYRHFMKNKPEFKGSFYGKGDAGQLIVSRLHAYLHR
ncbi:MAG: UDP-N-acetylglucosamine 2-epimerase (non-hydrolyzing) [Spirochaetes bacterium]|nr:UDP-N-acetylglucosamine 2-epimerase (non-hydrolyzing) [Spirochaetota bacterium]